MSIDLTATFPNEVITKTLARDIELPGGTGTFVLITLDNGFDHTKPNTFGPATLAGLSEVLGMVRARAEAGEIVGVGVTGKPFIFAVGADLTGVPKVTTREQALAIGQLGHRTFEQLRTLPVPTFAFINGAAMGGGVEIALSAAYRSISAGVPAVALPECFLGLVPGWRLRGLGAAAEGGGVERGARRDEESWRIDAGRQGRETREEATALLQGNDGACRVAGPHRQGGAGTGGNVSLAVRSAVAARWRRGSRCPRAGGVVRRRDREAYRTVGGAGDARHWLITGQSTPR